MQSVALADLEHLRFAAMGPIEAPESLGEFVGEDGLFFVDRAIYLS